MGGGVGLTIGFIFGSWSIIRLACSFSLHGLSLLMVSFSVGVVLVHAGF